MSVFGLLVWLVIVVAIVFAKGNRQEKQIRKRMQDKGIYGGGPYVQRPNSQQPNVNVQRYGTRSNSSVNKNFAVMPEHKKVAPNVERDCRAEDKHRSENNVHNNRTAQASAVPNVQRKKELPKRSNDNRPVAKRLYEGDHVPKGHRMVKCPYCAAENLIPYSANGKFKCYFCYTDL